MVNKHYQKYKERLQREHVKDIKFFLTKKKTKGEKSLKKISIFYGRRKRKKASVLSGTYVEAT